MSLIMMDMNYIKTRCLSNVVMSILLYTKYPHYLVLQMDPKSFYTSMRLPG
jgi:hypothetical protein